MTLDLMQALAIIYLLLRVSYLSGQIRVLRYTNWIRDGMKGKPPL